MTKLTLQSFEHDIISAEKNIFPKNDTFILVVALKPGKLSHFNCYFYKNSELYF